MTVNDLLQMGLSPSEFMAACVMLDLEDRGIILIKATELAKALGCGRTKAHEVLAALQEKGVFDKITVGAYTVHSVNTTPSTRTPVRPSEHFGQGQLANMAIANSYGSSGDPDGSPSSGGAAPQTGVEKKAKGIAVYRYQDDDAELGGVGKPDTVELTPAERRREARAAANTRKAEKKLNRTLDLQFHRSIDREFWDVDFVVKEFRHRILTHRKDLLGARKLESVSLKRVLQMWERDHDLTPQQAADYVDQFFADERMVEKLGLVDQTPHGVFLRFVQDRHAIAARQDVTDDAWLASLDEEWV